MIAFSAFLAVSVVNAAPLPQPVAQTFYMPQPPAMVADYLLNQKNNSPTYQMHILQSVSISQSGAILIYDHWEDGYEADLNNPVQSTTRIWGDNNPANGIAPGHSKDVFRAGDVVTMQADVVSYETYPTGARPQPPFTSAVIEYDGGDRLGSTRVIGVQAAAWGVPADDDDADPGYQQADMMTVYPVSGPQSRWGTNFLLPVGVNTDTEVGLSHQVFSYTGAFIQAGPGGSVIEVDADANGTFEIGPVTLAAGQTYFLNQANNITVNAGARITATNPVQVFETTGQVGINWGCRVFNIAPTTLWGNDYINPVSTGTSTGPDNSGIHRTSVLLRNENATAITVNYQLSNGTTGTVAVPAKSTVRYTPPDTGAQRNASRFWTTGSPGANFYAVAVADAGPDNATSHAFEWGFAMIEVNRLTTDGRLAWAPGTVGGGSGINGNVAWFSPVSATTVYIDYDGDPSTGPLTSPIGSKYDYSVAAAALSFNQVLDPDNDQTGLHIYTLDGTKVALIYGEDGNTSDAQTNLDIGGYLSPSNVNSIGDFVWIDFDNDGIQDPGEPGLANVKVTLTGPTGTVVTRTDSSGKYLFPDLVPGNYTVTVDTSTLPGGMIQTHDLDGTLDSTTTVALTPDTYYSDADFGYHGVGRIGDLVWEDWNSSGTRTFGELGINAARVNITYYGADGILGNADDIAMILTTAADGSYLAQGLPLGKYDVALDPASVLPGYAATTPLAITALQLTSGSPAALGSDFGLRWPIVKPLYLTNNGDPWTQALDRIDPVATADTTTSLSTEIGRNDVARNFNVRENFSVKSYANQNSDSVPPQAWTSNWIENDLNSPGEQRPQDGNIKVNDGGVGFLEFNLKKLPAQYIERSFNLNGASTATLTLVINDSELSSTNTMLVQVSNNGGSTWITLETLNSTFVGTKTYANLQSSLALTGNMVLRLKVGVSDGDKKIKIDTATVAWTVPAGVGPTSTSFTMSDPFSSAFTIDAGTIKATTYITAAQGNIPLTNPAIPAVLKYGATTVASLGNPTVTAFTAPNTFSTRDDFESNGYSGGSGWSGNWTEILEADGAASGDEMVLSDGGISLVIKVGKHDEGVYRQINLAGYDFATLSLDWRLLSDTNDLAKGIAVEVSNNGGATWSRLMLINGPKTSSYTNFTADITPYIATNTQIRFIGVGTDNDVYFDNVKIDYGVKRREYRLDWTFPVASPITIPSGQSLSLQLTNNIGGNSPFEVQYDSVAKASQVKMPAATYINVDSIGVYDAPYSGGVAVGQGDPGVTRYLRAVVSDPFGSNDITGLKFVIKSPSGAETVVNGTPVNAGGGLKTYEYVWSGAGLTSPGTYQVRAVADEGTEGIKAISGTANYNVFMAISGRVINDADGDGNLAERAGEAGLTGVTVRLYADANGDGVPDGAALQTVVTGANGAYTFPNLLSGGYVIIETNPNGYTSTNDTSPPNDDKIKVTLVSTSLTGRDFLDSTNPQIADIEGTVINDADKDGDLSERNGEPGIAGVTVRLWTDPNGDGNPADGVLYDTTVTDSGGDYIFVAVPSGSYVIVETNPSGYTSTNDTSGPNDDRIPVIRTGGTDSTDNDFLDGLGTTIEQNFGSIGDTVFWDKNQSGKVNAGEGIAGAVVFIDYNNNGVLDFNEPSATTDSAGNYTLANLPVGTFRVTVVPATLPAGFANTVDPDATKDGKTLVALTPGEDNTTTDFGYQGTGSIGDTIFLDTINPNGLPDSGEGIANVVVYVDANDNGIREPGEIAAITDANGLYLLPNLPAGTFKVRVDITSLPVNLRNTTDPDGIMDGAASVVLAAAQNNTTSDWGYRGIGSIKGVVYDDINTDATGAGTEPALANVEVHLFLANGTTPAKDAFGNNYVVLTDAMGRYEFKQLFPGNYVVKVDPNGVSLPDEAINYEDTDGTNPPADSDSQVAVTVISGGTVGGRNFGYDVPEYLIKTNDPLPAAGPLSPGDTISYTLSPRYIRGNLFTNAKVTDTIPEGTVYAGNAFPAPFSAPPIGGTGDVVWNLGSNTAGTGGTAPGVVLEPAFTRQTTATTAASGDTYISQESDGNDNYGTSTTLFIDPRTGENEHGLVKFDLSGIPANAIIDSATLGLMLNTQKLNIATAYEMSTAWTELGATWLTRNGTANWAGGGAFSSSDYVSASPLGSINNGTPGTQGIFYEISDSSGAPGRGLADVVADWVAGTKANNGLALIASAGSDGEAKYESGNNGTATKRPYLVLSYRVPKTTPVTPTVRDEFTNLSFTNNDGTAAWGTAWVENDYGNVGQDPNGGLFKVVDGAGAAGFLSFKTEKDDPADGQNIYRQANLSAGVTAASLSYTLLANGCDGGEAIVVEASNNGGSSYTVLQTINETTALQAYSFNLLSTLGTVGSQTRVRIRQVAADSDGKELRFENMQIQWTLTPGAGATSSLAASPTLTADGHMVTVSMTVTSGGRLDNIVPSALTVVNAQGGASLSGISAASPAMASIPAIGGSVTFTWTATANAGTTLPSSLAVRATATGTDEFGQQAVFSAATANSVLVSPDLAFDVTVSDPPTVTSVVNRGELTDDFILMNGVPSNLVENELDLVVDFGDLPDTGAGTATGNYQTTLADDGPHHIVLGVYLGATATDGENDGLPSAGASGDDLDGTDDENGVVIGTLIAGELGTFTATASGNGVLNAWADWNNDGEFQPGEVIASNAPLVAGANLISFFVPPGANIGDTAIRIRATNTTGQGGDSPTGLATSGEVEDYFAPVYLFGSITGTVRVDTDGNGSGDTMHGGVTLSLLDGSGAPVLDPGGVPVTTVTAPDGTYSFVDLTPGTYRVAKTTLSGYKSVSDKDGGNPDLINPVVVVSGTENTLNDFLEKLQKCPDLWTDWQDKWDTILGGETAFTDNPEGDRYSNLLEYAFCMPPHSGSRKPFCLVNSLSVAGAVDGVFSRTAGGPQDTTLFLDYSAALGDPTVWSSITLNSGNTTVTNNGNGTETVRIVDLESKTGLTAGAGFVRIRVQLDNGVDTAEDSTEVLGWVETQLGMCCRTYNNPFLPCATFTGTVDGVSGQAIDLSTSAGSSNLSTLLLPGVAYYIEVETGDLEGHRFDVTGATATGLILANDTSLSSASAPFNTLTGAAPTLLAGDRIALHTRRTLNGQFPPASFGSGATQETSDEVQVYAGGTWAIYWLFNNGGSPRWVNADDVTMADAGATVIPAGQGVFFHNRTAPAPILAYGEVRSHDFRRPLIQGVNMVGGGYPVDQSATGTNSRGLNLADGFFGSRNFKTADSFFVWRTDGSATASGYDTYFLLDGGTAQPTVKRWVKVGDVSITDRSAELLLKRDGGVMIRVATDKTGYVIAAPWTP